MDNVTKFNKLDAIARKRTFQRVGNDVMLYPCGFAWIHFNNFQDPFVKDLKNAGLISKNIGKGYSYWVSEGYNQSMNHKYEHAVLLAESLKEMGIECFAQSRMD